MAFERGICSKSRSAQRIAKVMDLRRDVDLMAVGSAVGDGVGSAFGSAMGSAVGSAMQWGSGKKPRTSPSKSMGIYSFHSVDC